MNVPNYFKKYNLIYIFNKLDEINEKPNQKLDKIIS